MTIKIDLKEREGLDRRLSAFLSMDSWTPAMGAMLVSGLAPTPGCLQVPPTASALQDLSRIAQPHLVADARSVMLLWEDDWQDSIECGLAATEPDTMAPIDFLSWCSKEYEQMPEIRWPLWLRYWLMLAGFPSQAGVPTPVPPALVIRAADLEDFAAVVRERVRPELVRTEVPPSKGDEVSQDSQDNFTLPDKIREFDARIIQPNKPLRRRVLAAVTEARQRHWSLRQIGYEKSELFRYSWEVFEGWGKSVQRLEQALDEARTVESGDAIETSSSVAKAVRAHSDALKDHRPIIGYEWESHTVLIHKSARNKNAKSDGGINQRYFEKLVDKDRWGPKSSKTPQSDGSQPPPAPREGEPNTFSERLAAAPPFTPPSRRDKLS
jgi:hypothetical protein